MPGSRFNASYVGERPDVLALVPPSTRSLLDVGCSVGTLGAAIKAMYGAHVTGIELAGDMAAEAALRLDEVLVGDSASIVPDPTFDHRRFDTIVCADVLEHLIDPWAFMASVTRCLTPGGTFIASIPNVRHFTTLFQLAICGRWPHRERGIHDRTHLRFFTLRTIQELLEGANLIIDSISTNYRLIERPHGINRYAKFLAIPGLRSFLAYQYLVSARKS